MASIVEIKEEMRAAWNRRDAETMRKLLHTGFTYAGPDGKEITGAESAVGIAKMFVAAFPDAVMEEARLFIDGDTAISETVVSGTHRGEFMGVPPSGRRAALRVCTVIEIREGKVYRMREYFDMLAFLLLLGLNMPVAVPASA